MTTAYQRKRVNVTFQQKVRQAASNASRSFLSYVVFVRGLLPTPDVKLACKTCGGERVIEGVPCEDCEGRGYIVHPSHHRVIAERLVYGDRMELILGPPGSAKSTYGVMYAEWILGRNPNYRWLIASEVANGIASTIVSEIAGTIENNEQYHLTFGELKDPTNRQQWSTQAFTLRPYISPLMARRNHVPPTPPPPFPWLPPRGRDGRITGKHPSCKAIGWRVGYAGARCEGIIADDLVSDRISRSPKLTKQVFDTLHQKMLARPVSPVLPWDQPEAASWPEYRQRVLIFGQRWAPRDLFGLLIEGQEGAGGGVIVYDNNPARAGLHVLENTE